MKAGSLHIAFTFASFIGIANVTAQPDLGAYKVDRNVVYGMYSGLALLLDVYYPEKSNGYGIVHISGSGWARPLSLDAPMLNHQVHVKLEGKALLDAGYTLFSLNHRATPRYTYPAAIDDVQRAVRFIRYHAKKYGIVADRIGAIGGSSGGHLVSMLGVLNGEGDPSDPSMINRESAKVQCIVTRAAPSRLVEGLGSTFLGIKSNMLRDTQSIEYHRALQASPTTHLTADDPPFLFLHGDQDEIVPLHHSEMMHEKNKALGIPSKLVVIEGAGHGPGFPGATDLPDLDGERVKWFDKHLKKTELEIIRGLTYKSVEGNELQLDLYLPKTGHSKPLVVWVHGGAWRKGSRSTHPAHPLLTDAGFAVASISYRLSYQAIFPAQIEDCKAAIRWLRAHSAKYGIDRNRIGAWGSSAGGHLVVLLGTTGNIREFEIGDHLNQSSQVQAVCDWYGPTDFLQMDAHAYPGSTFLHDAEKSPESELIGGPIQKNKKAARLANPITYISADDAPMLIMHGDQDKLVPVHQSQLLFKALQNSGVEADFHVIKGVGHGGKEFNTFENKQRVLNFFKDKLGLD